MTSRTRLNELRAARRWMIIIVIRMVVVGRAIARLAAVRAAARFIVIVVVIRLVVLVLELLVVPERSVASRCRNAR